MFKVWAQDCMTRIFPHHKPPESAGNSIHIQAAGNEIGCFQIGVSADPDALNDLRVEASDLLSDSGSKITKDNIEILYAGYVPVHWHSAGNKPYDLEGQAPGFYPDPLLPSLWRDVGRVQFPGTVSIWIRMRITDSIPSGGYKG